jgi:ABC-2 type transport system permease protein
VSAETTATPAHGGSAAPTAFGDDVRHFLNLTFTLAVTEWKLRFFGSVLGYLWTLMRPLLLFGVLYLVFTHVVKVGTTISHYPVYLLESIVLFQFFADSTSQGLQSLLQRESLLRKMRFPRMVIPLSVVLTNLFNLGMNMIAVLVFVLASGVQPRWTWLLVPVLVLALIVLATGAAMLTSALYVRFRDLAPIWEIILQIGFYA